MQTLKPAFYPGKGVIAKKARKAISYQWPAREPLRSHQWQRRQGDPDRPRPGVLRRLLLRV